MQEKLVADIGYRLSNQTGPNRREFTMLESLLIASLTIETLPSILLTVIQYEREVARRTQFQNNLKQVPTYPTFDDFHQLENTIHNSYMHGIYSMHSGGANAAMADGWFGWRIQRDRRSQVELNLYSGPPVDDQLIDDFFHTFQLLQRFLSHLLLEKSRNAAM